jgi:hypothetical protein
MNVIERETVAGAGHMTGGLPVGVRIIGSPLRVLAKIGFARRLEREFHRLLPPAGCRGDP